MKEIRLLDIVEDTIVDGTGFRTAIYAAGCPHRCYGCHNPQSWNICNGKKWSIDAILQIIENNPVSNVTFSGGEPFAQAEGFLELAKRIKSETRKTIWCYTGYRYEQLVGNRMYEELLSCLDVLVDGPFILKQKDPDLLFRGSSNQRIIPLNK
ncbi:MAG: anaerobic ribonucleoside-triphosphate reductase activating protein [Bacteroidales bacterium]|jgi:anaerobic ribonucleoside-triphosphate reductase activating protein|nr:anaerobic ribonucleoside-triphosphate reductase activating protein [Bacteroidales bacterium]